MKRKVLIMTGVVLLLVLIMGCQEVLVSEEQDSTPKKLAEQKENFGQKNISPNKSSLLNKGFFFINDTIDFFEGRNTVTPRNASQPTTISIGEDTSAYFRFGNVFLNITTYAGGFVTITQNSTNKEVYEIKYTNAVLKLISREKVIQEKTGNGTAQLDTYFIKLS